MDRIFKYFNQSIFWEEVQTIQANVRLDNVSERVFVQALQATTNRMANWSACRNHGVSRFCWAAGVSTQGLRRANASRM